MGEISGNNRSQGRILRNIRDARTLKVPGHEKKDIETAADEATGIVNDFFTNGGDPNQNGLDATEYRSLIQQLPESPVRTLIENMNQPWYEANPVTEGQKLYSENMDILRDFKNSSDREFNKVRTRVQDDLNLETSPRFMQVHKYFNGDIAAVRFNKLELLMPDKQQESEHFNTGVILGAEINPDTGKFENLNFNGEPISGREVESNRAKVKEKVNSDITNFNPKNNLEFEKYSNGQTPKTLHSVTGSYTNESGEKVNFQVQNQFTNLNNDAGDSSPNSADTKVIIQYENGSGAVLNGSEVPKSFFTKIIENEPENSTGLR
ncbi:MAG: hypothetical protein HRT47_08510 [Candidatus Caenarcaniphilales bacterium]|nr:hypothetical protein [Candidatus Caenarcaniphilales bacterium]